MTEQRETEAASELEYGTEDRRRAARRRAAGRVVVLVLYCGYVVLISDLANGGYLTRDVAARVQHFRRSRERRPLEPPASMISAMHQEAHHILQEAAAQW